MLLLTRYSENRCGRVRRRRFLFGITAGAPAGAEGNVPAWDAVVFEAPRGARANLTVARLTLSRPMSSLRPQFAVVPLDVRNPYSIALLLGIITISPGTIAADLDEEHRLVLVQWLHEPDPARAVALIKSRYERPLLETLG
jgi:hypothetical protein